jgi:hypothetical protein
MCGSENCHVKTTQNMIQLTVEPVCMKRLTGLQHSALCTIDVHARDKFCVFYHVEFTNACILNLIHNY